MLSWFIKFQIVTNLFAELLIQEVYFHQFALYRFLGPIFIRRRMNCGHDGDRLAGMEMAHRRCKLHRDDTALIGGRWIWLGPGESYADIVGMVLHRETYCAGLINIAIAEIENIVLPRFDNFFRWRLRILFATGMARGNDWYNWERCQFHSWQVLEGYKVLVTLSNLKRIIRL